MHTPLQADLSACDKDPIHIPDLIQPFGALVAMPLDSRIIASASRNLDEVLGVPALDVLGSGFDVLIGKEQCGLLAEALENGELHSVSPKRVTIPQSGRNCWMFYHVVDGFLIAEFEPVPSARSLTVVQSSPGVSVLTSDRLDKSSLSAESGGSEVNQRGEPPFKLIHDCETSEALAALLAREVSRLTGFDRVMVYRFDEDWHGMVIAEERNDVYPHGFLGHHFPASDIPLPARRLFTLNRMRMIPDATYQPVPMLGLSGMDRAPLDMTYSALRSVAPVHLEYLGNMGVRASLTISLMNGSTLWGMITCHHASPRHVPVHARAECRILAELASYAIANIERSINTAQRQQR